VFKIFISGIFTCKVAIELCSIDKIPEHSYTSSPITLLRARGMTTTKLEAKIALPKKAMLQDFAQDFGLERKSSIKISGAYEIYTAQNVQGDV
jgi:hypothetical protein